jgi:hypothetical protein
VQVLELFQIRCLSTVTIEYDGDAESYPGLERKGMVSSFSLR